MSKIMNSKGNADACSIITINNNKYEIPFSQEKSTHNTTPKHDSKTAHQTRKKKCADLEL